MRQRSILILSDKDEEFVNRLIEIGTKRNVATVLVFLANTPEATSREIERSLDLRQPEVSLAIVYQIKKGWVKFREINLEGVGRPAKVFSLALPMKEIITAIEKEKKKELSQKLALVKKMRDYI